MNLPDVDDQTDMAASLVNWALADIVDDLSRGDAARIAHHLGGVVANDDRIREAIQAALDRSAPGRGASEAIVVAVARALAKQEA